MVQIMLFQDLWSNWILKIAIGCHLTFPKMDFHFTLEILSVFLRQIKIFWLTLAFELIQFVPYQFFIHYYIHIQIQILEF